MMQEILTWVTVAGAVFYTLYTLGKTLFSKKKESLCAGGCSQCEARQQLLQHQKKSPKKKTGGSDS